MTAVVVDGIGLVADRLDAETAYRLAEAHHDVPVRPTVYLFVDGDAFPVDVLRGGSWSSAVAS